MFHYVTDSGTGVLQFTYGKNCLGREAGVGPVAVSAIFWSRIMISRGFEAVNTVFGGYFGFGGKTTFSPRT
jgi:hypothetical protein